jgi:peptidoglycan-associated lipoprotein
MFRKGTFIITLICCIGLMVMSCSPKTVVKEDATIRKEELAKIEAERVARENEARAREEAAKEAAKDADRKEFERSLVAKKEPGIEGVIFESPLLKDIHFDFDKYEISPGDTALLKRSADLLKKNPTVKIQIEGHCDERGTTQYNLALGERRANSTRNYLLSLGIPPEYISTISYGEEKPLDSGHNEESWVKNRRAHFVILSK